MSFDLIHIWAHMSVVSRIIAGALVLMALSVAAVTIERLIALASSASASRRFAPSASSLVERGEFEQILPLAARHKDATLARLFAAILTRYMAAMSKSPADKAIELVKTDVVRHQETISTDLRRGMSVLATVGSVSPFVGLLGTVVGIISAFQGIGDAGSAGLGAVSVGISEALVETALGLVVAIPTVIAFNYLQQRISAVEGTLGRSAGRLIDELALQHRDDHGSFQAAA
jgi:biopolymer transport protein ExbB/TolQ